MHQRDIDFVLRIQDRALSAITEEDDFYFTQWMSRMRGAQAKPEPVKTPDGATTKILKKPTQEHSRQTPSQEFKSRSTKSRAWAQTQRTLGFVSRSSLKAPRKLLDIGKPSIADEEDEEKVDKSRPLTNTYWRTRVGIESALTLVLKLEDRLRNGSTNSNVDDDFESLRADLFGALKLPQERSSHKWAGAQFLRCGKGKKLILRSFPLLSNEQRKAFMCVASRNLPMMLFSAEKTVEYDFINRRMSSLLSSAFKHEDLDLDVLTECLLHIASKAVYDDALLFYLLKENQSAAVLEVLLIRGERLAAEMDGASESATAWASALGALQSRAVEVSRSQGA